MLALTVGLALGVGSPPLVNRDLVFLGLVAVAWIGESLFPTTVEGERLTRTGALHYLFAILIFGFTYAAISGLTPVLVKLHPWHSEKACWTAWPGQSWSGLYSSWPRCSPGCGASSAGANDSSWPSRMYGWCWWAEGQHNLWTGKWGGEPGRSGLDDAGYAAAIARAAEGQLEPDPAEACGFGRNQPGPYDLEAGR